VLFVPRRGFGVLKQPVAGIHPHEEQTLFGLQVEELSVEIHLNETESE